MIIGPVSPPGAADLDYDRRPMPVAVPRVTPIPPGVVVIIIDDRFAIPLNVVRGGSSLRCSHRMFVDEYSIPFYDGVVLHRRLRGGGRARSCDDRIGMNGAGRMVMARVAIVITLIACELCVAASQKTR